MRFYKKLNLTCHKQELLYHILLSMLYMLYMFVGKAMGQLIVEPSFWVVHHHLLLLLLLPRLLLPTDSSPAQPLD